MAIYLDHNATTPLHEQVLDAMLPYMGQVSGNASSLHRFGRLQRDAIEQARTQVAALINARAEQVIFTSGGTEANNLLLKGLCAEPGVGRIALSAIEHLSLLAPARAIAEQQACALDLVPVDTAGRVTVAALEQALSVDTALVSVMMANNETGVVQDIDALAAVARAQGAWFHTDASQAAGKLAIDFEASAVHAMTLSAHKFYGPLGVGALVIDRQLPLHAQIHGGAHENGLRAGTENVAAIVGFGKAAELAAQQLAERQAHVQTLRDELERRLLAYDDVEVFARDAQRLPNTLQFGVAGFDGETLLMQFDRHGIAVSSGSACTSGKTEPSHVLAAMGVPAELAISAVRVSFGRHNTMEDVDVFMRAFEEIMRMKQAPVMMAATV